MLISHSSPIASQAGPAGPISRERRASAQRSALVLPSEIAFLGGFGIAPHILLEAMEIAVRTGVCADAALLASGAVAEETFYRSLARRLGVPFLGPGVRVAPTTGTALTIAAGMAPAPRNSAGLRFILAPQGAAITALLEARRVGGAVPSFAVTTPRRFAAAVRVAHAVPIAAAAAQDIVVDGRNLSARSGPPTIQVIVLAGLTALFGYCVAATPVTTCFAISLPILLAIVARLAAVGAGAPPRPAAATLRTRDFDLPVYTILVPLFREGRVAAKLIRSLDRLDYPHARLDIKLLVETADTQTRDALHALDLPARYEILVVPPGHPRTKPRALNVGLDTARGSLLVVYDAEDEPDPDQLRAAARRFEGAPTATACLQAKLAIHNMADGLLPQLFAIEYGALFDVVNPGLAALRLPMLLGGTSNHFRTAVLRKIGGWDAWNVTEDADLGIRLARRGYDVEVLDSSTFEEAPDKLGAWLKQRSRWYKGWMQTLGVHTRDPAAAISDLGPGRGLICLVSLATGLVSGMLSPVLMTIMVVQLNNATILHPNGLFDGLIAATACLVFASGIVCALFPVVLGIVRRRRWRLLALLIVLPVYYVLLMLAAWMALIDLVWKPHRWHKTEHGLGKRSHARGLPQPRTAKGPVAG